MNKVILLGRLTKEPEIRFTQTNNTMIATFSLAVNRRFAKEGEERQTDFFTIVTYPKLSEFVQKHLHKGLQICVTGRLQNRSWEDESGTKHYVTEVIAEEIYFADTPRKTDNESVLGASTSVNSSKNENQDDNSILDGDDLPF